MINDDYDQCYALEAQEIYQLNATKGKKYFANLNLSTTGDAFTVIKVQIDSAATCNTIAEDALSRLEVRPKLENSPYIPGAALRG